MKKKHLLYIILIVSLFFFLGLLFYQYKFIDMQIDKYIANNQNKLDLFDYKIYISEALQDNNSNIKHSVFYRNLNIYSSYYVVNKKGRKILKKELYYNNKKYIKNNKLLYDIIPNKYKGSVNNNYLWFNQMLWRIVSKDEDGIKIVSESPLTSISWGKNLSYKESYIHKWLNDYFLGFINDNLIVKNKDGDKVLILTIEDYNSSLSKNNTYINDFDNNYYMLNNDQTPIMYDADLGKTRKTNKNNSLAIKPVIILNKKTKIKYGNGTKKDYYIIEELNSKKEKLSNKQIGSYVVFSNKLWRIIGFDERGNTKLKLNYFDSRKTFYAFDTEEKNKRCIGIENFQEEDVTGCNSIFDSNVKNPPLYKKKKIYHAGGNNIAYYLNSVEDKDSFYNQLSNKNWIVNHEWNLGEYKHGEDYNSTQKGKTVTEKIGLVRIGEMFSSNDDGVYYFTLTPYDSKTINYIDFYGRVLDEYPSIPIGIRPSLYLNNKVFVYDGNGTIEKPYLLKEDK